MFPSNLHKNIIQLDRQISLLENECRNIEIEKKKKTFKPESSCSANSKISSALLKSPAVKVTGKKADSSIRCRKPTPPISARLQSTSSLQTHRTKTCSEIGNNSIGRKKKQCGPNADLHACSCHIFGSPHFNVKKENKFMKCVCCNEIAVSDLANGHNFEESKRDRVLHKELVFPNSGGAIEVTVTEKSGKEKENLPLTQKPTMRKSLNSESRIDNDLEGCKCQIKGQKWSEILCENSSKKKQSNSGNCVKNQILAEETKTYRSMNFTNNEKAEENISLEQHNKIIPTIQEESFEVPIKLPAQCNERITRQTKKFDDNKFVKEIQCVLQNYCYGQPEEEAQTPEKIVQLLLYICQQIPNEILNKLSYDTETIPNVKKTLAETCEENKSSVCNGNIQDNSACLNSVKHHCENLLKEKLLLSQELMSKENAIATMKKREEEYLWLIANLKLNLEKTKGNAQEGIDAIKELNLIKNKLFEQMKVSEALKKNHVKLQQIMEQCSLENDKLKTQIKICKLETQKHEVLLAGKEVEIKRYREEIQNFQRQISDHLATLKSNSQVTDIEKMIEAIFQQSQAFIQTNLENDLKDSSKTQNVLMHSSPTSTKTSCVNSSWKQISSIHDHDQSKANSDVIYLNDEINGKDFFQLFEKNSFSELITPKKLKEPPVEKFSLTDKKEVKNPSSFTSCLSENDDHNSSKSSNRDSLISKRSLISDGDNTEEYLRKESRISLDKAQNNIDELLKNMKLKFSKKIFETSLPSYTTEDFLDISQISNISQI